MCFVSYEKLEGLPDLEIHAYFIGDGSATMAEIELQTREPKHKRVAWLVQETLNRMDSPQYADAFFTVAYFSAERTGVKVISLLEAHNPHDLKTYTGNSDLTFWDPLTPENRKHGMGNMTPIGSAIAWARERAQEWVNAATGQVQRRAVIYLLSDGMNNFGPDGRDEKKALEAFNATSEKGAIRLATIGYFQLPPGQNQEEDEGRQLLSDLPLNKDAYFEADNVDEILRYILGTFTQDMDLETA